MHISNWCVCCFAFKTHLAKYLYSTQQKNNKNNDHSKLNGDGNYLSAEICGIIFNAIFSNLVYDAKTLFPTNYYNYYIY